MRQNQWARPPSQASSPQTPQARTPHGPAVLPAPTPTAPRETGTSPWATLGGLAVVAVVLVLVLHAVQVQPAPAPVPAVVAGAYARGGCPPWRHPTRWRRAPGRTGWRRL